MATNSYDLSSRLLVKSVVANSEVDKVFYEFALNDLQQALRYVAAEEIQTQINLGNNPTSLLVDSRGNRAIDVAERRVQAFFASTDIVYEALVACWSQIQISVPRKSGRAALSYEVWFNDHRVGDQPSSAKSLIESMKPGKDYVRIVGPVVAYGRKVNYNPRGTSKFKRKTVIRTKTLTIKSKTIIGIMEKTEKLFRSRFPSLYIRESWVTTSALPVDGRTPGLVIGFARKGRLTGV